MLKIFRLLYKMYFVCIFCIVICILENFFVLLWYNSYVVFDIGLFLLLLKCLNYLIKIIDKRCIYLSLILRVEYKLKKVGYS